MRAFILIETEVGRSRTVASTLRAFDQIQYADVITGAFDVIALAEAPDMSTIAELVTSNVQGVPGVVRTITCVAAG